VERLGDQPWEELRGQERREQGADRWQGGDGIGRHGGDAVRRQAGGQGVRQRAGDPGDHQGEEHADRQRRPEFWNVERMPEATPRWCSGTLLMIADVLVVVEVESATHL
jgi:hypothetical protein